MAELQAEFTEIPKTRARVYIDGFNLYFSVIKPNPSWKWLNFESYFQAIRPDDTVERIHYFTAIVEPKRALSPKRDRQAVYLNALRTLETLDIILGTYRQRSVRCGATCRQKYDTPEEKKTDVNIAIRMIDDAINGRVDRIILVSGDSDMEPAVEYIRKACPNVQVLVYIPQDPKHPRRRNNRHYQQLGAKVKPLPLNEIPECQFSENISHDQGTYITRPENWK